MGRIKCVSMENGMLNSIPYSTLKGNRYLFNKGSYTDVPDKDDEEEFLIAGNGLFFQKEGVINKVKKAVEKIVSSKPSLMTAVGIKSLNKTDQKYILLQIYGKDHKVSSLESIRVKELLEAQDKGNDLMAILKGRKD